MVTIESLLLTAPAISGYEPILVLVIVLIIAGVLLRLSAVRDRVDGTMRTITILVIALVAIVVVLRWAGLLY